MRQPKALEPFVLCFVNFDSWNIRNFDLFPWEKVHLDYDVALKLEVGWVCWCWKQITLFEIELNEQSEHNVDRVFTTKTQSRLQTYWAGLLCKIESSIWIWPEDARFPILVSKWRFDSLSEKGVKP